MSLRSFLRARRPRAAASVALAACATLIGAAEPATAAPATPAPAITALKPSIGPADSKVTILGTDLGGATEVNFSGTPVAFEQVTPTEIEATAPTLNFIKAPPPIITMDVSVTTPGGTSANTTADDFRYFTGTTDAPPSTAPIDKTIKLTCTNAGIGFVPRTLAVRVTSDPVVRPVFAGPSTVTGLRAQLVFDPDALRLQVVTVLGSAAVTVSSLGLATYGPTLESGNGKILLPLVKPGSPLTLPPTEIRADVAPRLVTPATGTFGAIKPTDAAFKDPVLFLEPVTLRIQSTPVGGTSTVTETTCSASENDSFITSIPIYSEPNPVQPEVTSVSPGSGAPGTIVTVKGKFLYHAESVSFLYGTSTDITPVSDDELRVRVPELGFAPGVALDTRVVVNTDHGQSFGLGDAARFTILLPAPALPVIRSVSPKTATAGFGQVLLIRGTRFGKVSKVLVGKKNASFVQLSPSQVLAFAPAQPKGSYLLTVTNAAGTSAPGPSTLITYR